MKNLQTPRALADCDFRVGYPRSIPTRRSRLIETIGGWTIILALVVFSAWAITGV